MARFTKYRGSLTKFRVRLPIASEVRAGDGDAVTGLPKNTYSSAGKIGRRRSVPLGSLERKRGESAGR